MNAKTVGVWDLKSGQLRHRLRHGKPLVMLDFSPIDHRLCQLVDGVGGDHLGCE